MQKTFATATLTAATLAATITNNSFNFAQTKDITDLVQPPTPWGVTYYNGPEDCEQLSTGLVGAMYSWDQEACTCFYIDDVVYEEQCAAQGKVENPLGNIPLCITQG